MTDSRYVTIEEDGLVLRIRIRERIRPAALVMMAIFAYALIRGALDWVPIILHELRAGNWIALAVPGVFGTIFFCVFASAARGTVFGRQMIALEDGVLSWRGPMPLTAYSALPG